jgi:hypothetical protein
MFVCPNIEARSLNHFFLGKALSITYSVACVCSLSYPACEAHALIALSFVASATPPCSSTLPHKWHDFRKNIVVHKMCALIYSSTLLWRIFFILRRIRRNIVINIHRSLCIVRFKSCRILKKVKFYGHIFENYSNVRFHEIMSGRRRVCFMRTDRELIVAFRNFSKASKDFRRRIFLFTVFRYSLHCGRISLK